MATTGWARAGEGMRRNKTSRTLYAYFRYRGKTYRHSLKTKDKTIGRNRLAKFRQKLEKGAGRDDAQTTVVEIAPRFNASLAGMSDSTQVRAKGHVKAFVAQFGDRNPREIKPMDVQEWLQALREEMDFGEDCWNKYRATLQKFFAFLIENAYADENPAKGLDYLKAKAARKFTPSTEQVTAVLNHIKTAMPKERETVAFLEFMVLTGQGRAETVNAQWMDILPAEKKINFYRQKTRAIAHTIPLFPALKAFLDRRSGGLPVEPTAPIFKIQSAKKAIGKACEKLGIPHMGHHNFRRYFITQRLMEGVPPNMVAKWVGHRTSEMVMEIYASVPNSFEVSFAEKIPGLTTW